MSSDDFWKRLSICTLIAVFGCAGPRAKDDPLKNTKKLFSEGHRSLYYNGAFAVPHTSLSVIPPGPSALDVAFILMRVRPRQSFQEAVKNAAQSVYIVSEGTKLTFHAARDIRGAAAGGAEEIRKAARAGSTLLVGRSSELGRSLIGRSWELSQDLWRGAPEAAVAVKESGAELAEAAESTAEAGASLAAESRAAAKDLSEQGRVKAAREAVLAQRSFVRGYAVLPIRLRERAAAAGDSLATAGFGKILKSENEKRGRWSAKSVDFIIDTVKNYPANVAGKMGSARQEFQESYRTTGVPLASLQALRRVLEGFFGEATVLPAANVAGASLGYVGVNLLAFPALVVAREGGAVAEVAVEAGWDAARSVFDLTAPTGEAALAGMLALSEGIAYQTAAGLSLAGGSMAGYGAEAIAKAGGVLVKGGTAAAGQAVRYIGVPLASAGVAVGGGTVGAMVGGIGMGSGGALRVSGETAAMTGLAFGNVIAGATMVGGAAGSAAVGSSRAYYELSKAAIVPPSYVLAGGLVLDYATVTHLGAQSILAAADCAYLVLSLEGPRWVLYAVRGKKSDPAAGAIVDLSKVRDNGEEILNIPITDVEMKDLVHTVYENLPSVTPK